MRFLMLTTDRKHVVKSWFCQCSSPVGTILPPVDLASAAAVLRDKGHAVKILELQFHNNPVRAYQEQLRSFKPDAVLTNLTTNTANSDHWYLAQRPKGTLALAFGTHATALPTETLEKGADFVLLGDPEAALLNLLEHDFQGGQYEGVAYRDAAGQVVVNKPAFVKDLDVLPWPALDMLEIGKYYAPFVRGAPFTVIMGSRGCPHACTFCTVPGLMGRRWRVRSPENVVAELAYDVERFGIRRFYFLDPTLNITEKRVTELCGKIIERGLKIGWVCEMRVDAVSLEMLQLMRQAGCHSIFYGVEDPANLDEIKKAVTWEEIKRAFALTRKAGISPMAFAMLFPDQAATEGEYEERMLSMLDELDTDAIQLNTAIPFPCAPMYSQLKQEGLLSDNWEDYDAGGSKLPYPSRLDLIRIKRRVYTRFYLSRPKTLVRVISQMRPRDVAQLFRGVKAMVRGS